LMLWGERDGIVTPDYGRAYAALIRGAEFKLIEGAGHHPEQEQAERFVQAVSGFLGD
jgi:pimeloyl-ACP methyl ester carboxylesterase